MTQVTKQFVSLDDLTALRVVCGHCEASLTLPIMSNTFSLPTVCPSCKNDWYEKHNNGLSIGDITSALVRDVKALRRALDSKSTANINFLLDVEVKGLAVFPSSSNRDA